MKKFLCCLLAALTMTIAPSMAHAETINVTKSISLEIPSDYKKSDLDDETDKLFLGTGYIFFYHAPDSFSSGETRTWAKQSIEEVEPEELEVKLLADGLNETAASLSAISDSEIHSVKCMTIGGLSIKAVSFDGVFGDTPIVGETAYFIPSDGNIVFLTLFSVIPSIADDTVSKEMNRILGGWTVSISE